MKEKLQLEYALGKISTGILWESISTPQGLSAWFADDVTVVDNEYTFFWENEPNVAVVKMSRIGVYMKFHWKNDEDAKTYFEMRILVSELTKDVTLSITDFVTEGDKDDTIQLWNQDVEFLRNHLGA